MPRLLLALLGITFVASLAAADPSTPGALSAADSAGTQRAHGSQTGDIAGSVVDSTDQQPLPSAPVVVSRDGKIVTRTSSDAFGRFTFHGLTPGAYEVSARYLGYRSATATITVAGGETPAVAEFRLGQAPIRLADVEVIGATPLSLDTRTGNQTFDEDAYHGAPTTTTSQILQQSIAGAVRAPTGEVHIRGQHAEYTYYLDGVPVPSGITGSLNELFDPSVVNEIQFVTGGWDAEYGNKNTAIVNVTTRIPSGAAHADLAGYGGYFKSSGESVSASSRSGKFGFFLSGARQLTDMRSEPVVADPGTDAAINFHNHGEDLFTFGKVQYLPTLQDIVNLDANWSQTRFQIPFDSTGGVSSDDNQKDANAFVNLGWRHHFEHGSQTGRSAEMLGGLFYRRGSLDYTPGAADDPQFIFFPDTLTPYNLQESRSFSTVGLKLDYTLRPHHGLEYKVGTLSSMTSGREDFVTRDAGGNPGPASNSDLKGSDVGVYAQAAIAPSDRWEIRPGVRYDNHDAPFAGNRSQISPRLRLNLYPSPANTIWLYYGRQFIPTNVEDLRAITSVAQAGVVATPTLPERDDFFEAGFLHRFPVGIVAKLTGYHKISRPGIDDNTVPGSAIVTSVNIDKVWVTGIESAIEIKPAGPVSGFVNLAVCHAYGEGPITGGFFPEDTPSGKFDLDHDQRISSVVGATYSQSRLFVSASGIYGTGLTNGGSADASYGTGLFDMNRSIHVASNLIVNASAGYTINLGQIAVRPQVYVENLFDRKYLLKGAFFSGASVGRPRSIVFRLNTSL